MKYEILKLKNKKLNPKPRINKTRGLRRWPTGETIVLRSNNFNPGSREIFEFQVRNSKLFGTSLPTFQECVHKNSEIFFIQSWRYPFFLDLSKEVYQLPDWQTYKKIRITLSQCTNISGMPLNILERYLIQSWSYSFV